MSLNLDDANEEMYYKKYLKYKEKYIKLVAEEQAAGAVESSPKELYNISAEALSETISNLIAAYNGYVKQYNYTLLVNKNKSYKDEQTALTKELDALKKKTTELRKKKTSPSEFQRKSQEITAAETTANNRKAELTRDIAALNLTMNADPYSGIVHNLDDSDKKGRVELNNLTVRFVFKEHPRAPKKGAFS